MYPYEQERQQLEMIRERVWNRKTLTIPKPTKLDLLIEKEVKLIRQLPNNKPSAIRYYSC